MMKPIKDMTTDEMLAELLKATPHLLLWRVNARRFRCRLGPNMSFEGAKPAVAIRRALKESRRRRSQ